MARRNEVVNSRYHPFTVRAHGREEGNAFQVRDSAGNVVFGLNADGEASGVTQVLADDGAITLKHGVVLLTKGSALAATLAAPTATIDDGKRLIIIATTAAAHTVTQTTPGFNEGGTGSDVATFGGAKGDSMVIAAYGGAWYVAALRNVTLA